MRTAGYEAGMASPDHPEQLLIALEPEAASIYCRKLRLNQLVPVKNESNIKSSILDTVTQSSDEKGSAGNNLKTQAVDDWFTKGNCDRRLLFMALIASCLVTGTRYMVVDCGGGTVDITVHEIQDKLGSLKELHKATGELGKRMSCARVGWWYQRSVWALVCC